MLFIVTGEVRTGKTSWLVQLRDELVSMGIPIYGVLAPGVWSEGLDPSKPEKIGIDNILLPENDHLRFASKRGVGSTQNHRAETQSAKARLGWEISDQALKQVNDHFEHIDHEVRAAKLVSDAVSECGANAGLLIVDELGRLELEHGGGLTKAIGLLKEGPTPLYRHAIVVVRQQLVDKASSLFESSWRNISLIEPCSVKVDAFIEEIGWV